MNAPSTANLFPAGQFTGAVQDNAKENDMQGFTPEGWNLTSFTGGPYSDRGAYFCYDGAIHQLNRIIETYEGFLMCGGAQSGDGNRKAYLTCGYRNVKGTVSTSSFSNVNLGILSGEQVATLFESVTYSLSYEYRDFNVSSGTHRPGERIVTISRKSGSGTFNDSASEFKINRTPAESRTTEYPYDAIKSGFKKDSQNFTVKNGNINSFTILYSVGKSYGTTSDITYPDVGSFISNIQVKAVNWNKLQSNGSVAPANGG